MSALFSPLCPAPPCLSHQFLLPHHINLVGHTVAVAAFITTATLIPRTAVVALFFFPILPLPHSTYFIMTRGVFQHIFAHWQMSQQSVEGRQDKKWTVGHLDIGTVDTGPQTLVQCCCLFLNIWQFNLLLFCCVWIAFHAHTHKHRVQSNCLVFAASSRLRLKFMFMSFNFSYLHCSANCGVRVFPLLAILIMRSGNLC